MATTIDPASFKDALVVLGAASVVIPLFHRLKVSPIVGFIIVGILLGPAGLGSFAQQAPFIDWVTIADRQGIAVAAEFGIALLLFVIGLELSFERLRLMARLIVGLGGLQIVFCAAALTGIALALGQPGVSAAILGIALAMSSTAIVIQVLSDEGKLTQPSGRASFAILLAQDLAVVPILFGITVLGEATGTPVLAGFAEAFGKAALAVVVLIGLGRLLLRPLFRLVADVQSPEFFLAACLLVILATSLATAAAGLSLAMGALIAGLLLAETEYRRQIEVLIEPFKGLLLGVFLVSVGMGIDINIVIEKPIAILGAVMGLLFIKGAIIFGLALLVGFRIAVALKAASLLAAGSEFTLVILGTATGVGLIDPTTSAQALCLAALTMAAIPLLSALSERAMPRLAPPVPIDPALMLPDEHDGAPRVLIAGFGRVGRLVADMLDVHGIPYLAIDINAKTVARARREGKRIYYGNLTELAFLRRSGIATARALVVTLDTPKAAETAVEVARSERSNLLIVARARDARHAARLYAVGASDVVPETIEASLQLGEAVLIDLDVPMGHVIASVHERRAAFRSEVQAMAMGVTVRDHHRRHLSDLVVPDKATETANTEHADKAAPTPAPSSAGQTR